jgi:glutamine synthetase|tara:strand:+ start:6451 stop:7458 length:1008 start_codon:yes stop_codon:yes gene_type:complete
MKLKFEYIWLDGYTPEPNLRSKTRIINMDPDTVPIVDDLPSWTFDGSSTNQALGNKSDCILQPERIYPDPFRDDGYLVLCEVLNDKGEPHLSNDRNKISDDNEEWWFGFEQEYVLYKNGRILGWPEDGYPLPQGNYYCGIGNNNVVGRDIMEDHMNACLTAGLIITGTNAEVLLGQWEYQLFGKGAKNTSDDLWISRYILQRLVEVENITINYHPKPIKGDWNGSGMHVNFSNDKMREVGGESMMKGICEQLKLMHQAHMIVYGSDNKERLTGKHETQNMEIFSYGVGDRGASIRIPIWTVLNEYKGYLEDRRPSSNANPYKITNRIIQTIKEVK